MQAILTQPRSQIWSLGILGCVAVALLGCKAALNEPAGSSGSSKTLFRCKLGTVPCGNGCMPQGAICCNTGSTTESSYCTNRAGGGCYPVPVGESIVQPDAVSGEGQPGYWCSQTPIDTQQPEFASFTCKTGMHACGNACYALDTPCCPDGSSDSQCPVAAVEAGSCRAGNDACGLCIATGLCVSCTSGEQCSVDPCNPEGGGCFNPNGVVDNSSGDGTGGSGACPTVSDLCGCVGSGCSFASTVRLPCQCPSGTSQYGDEIGCAPGQSSGCIQCVCN